MPKHKKFLKSEKSKVKLKDYKLPKGLNVTKTDFKVKKIVINEQLRNTYNADGTVIRKENIKVIQLCKYRPLSVLATYCDDAQVGNCTTLTCIYSQQSHLIGLLLARKDASASVGCFIDQDMRARTHNPGISRPKLSNKNQT